MHTAHTGIRFPFKSVEYKVFANVNHQDRFSEFLVFTCKNDEIKAINCTKSSLEYINNTLFEVNQDSEQVKAQTEYYWDVVSLCNSEADPKYRHVEIELN